MKIAMCASEMVPFAKTGGLADVTGALPLVLERLGEEVIVVMPKYKSLEDNHWQLRRTGEGWPYTIIGDNIKVYFVENNLYFNRDSLYGNKHGDYKDNLERFAYFCRQAIELTRRTGFKPDIMHLHDWQSALVPVYLKHVFSQDRFYSGIRTLLTIHNIGYQGIFNKTEFPKLGLDWKLFDIDCLEFYGRINLLKCGILSADAITTVSPTYSRQIQSQEFGAGLENILKPRSASLSDILNGLDYSLWDPRHDEHIFRNFSPADVEAGKQANKLALQRVCGLPFKKDTPLFGLVLRLAQQKGIDILLEAMQDICAKDLQMVILGSGDVKYENLLSEAAREYPDKLSLHLKFDEALARKIYAGSDVFVMPSYYEPCGLGQMIALRYASIPLVYKTGGLADTVNQENGFVFTSYDKRSLVNALEDALQAFKHKRQWGLLRQKAMEYDFSWEESAKKYQQLYRNLSR